MSRLITDPKLLRLVQGVRIDMERARKPARFGVGGPSGIPAMRRSQSPCNPALMPDCPPRGRLCDMQKVGAFTTVAGGSAFTLTVEPEQTKYFEPWGVRMTVFDASNPDLNHRVLITAVQINDLPQEVFNDPAPDATTRDGILSDAWSDPDGDAVYVPWGTFSDVANKRVLKVYGFAFGYSAGTTLAVHLTIYGQGRSEEPKCGCGITKDQQAAA